MLGLCKLILLLCSLVLAPLWTPCCYSMQIQVDPLEKVLKSTEVAVIADILSVADRSNSAMWRSITFHAKVVKTIFGEDIKSPMLHCLYQQGRPHQRGTKFVSPLVTGSGIEFDIKSGDRVIFLIERAPVETKTCLVLRIETLKNESTVKELMKRE
jgi:hypothetical protein